MTPGPARPIDPGLQPQRTALAWQRTALAVLGGAVLVGVVGVRLRVPLITVAAAAVGVAVAALVLRRPRIDRPEDNIGPWPTMRLLVACVVALGLTGTGAALVQLFRDR